MDARLNNEKKHKLIQITNALRSIAHLEILDGNCSEAELLKKIDGKEYHIVFAPWYRYLAWTKIEAYYGLTRTSGPTFAGYFCDKTLPYEIGEQVGYYRTILLDFFNLNLHEITILIQSLANDKQRSGLKALLDQNTPIYCENWSITKKLSELLDSVLAINEIKNELAWFKRSNTLRICLNALWSLIYEEGPGKIEIGQSRSPKNLKAYFQVGVCTTFLGFRLCYTTASYSPKEALNSFWPNQKNPSPAAQLLLKFSDFLRIHSIADTTDIEIVAGFFPSTIAENTLQELHTFWVEPLIPSIISEPPFEMPQPYSPHLRNLLNTNNTLTNTAETYKDKHFSKAKLLQTAMDKITDLKKELSEKIEKINELKHGGVGCAPIPPPPDAEALLDALQDRFSEVDEQIHIIKEKIDEIEKRKYNLADHYIKVSGKEMEIEILHQKILFLKKKEENWIQQIANILKNYKDIRKVS